MLVCQYLIEPLVKSLPISIDAGRIGKNGRAESKRLEVPDRLPAGQGSSDAEYFVSIGKLLLGGEFVSLAE